MLAVGGAGGLALWPGRAGQRPKRPLHVLSQASFPVLVAVAARVCRGTSADPVEIAHSVDTVLQHAMPEAQSDMNKTLALLENALGGLLLRGQSKPFTRLDADAQDAALLAWRDSRLVLIRGAYHALRKLCLSAHYATPESWPAVDYGGPLIPKPDPPPITATGPLVVAAMLPDEVEP